jgi:hypothetical protein
MDVIVVGYTQECFELAQHEKETFIAIAFQLCCGIRH